MSTNVLPQLRAVEAELSAQLASLTSQIEVAQEKLDGIQTVIQMYSETESSAGSSSKAPVEASESTSDELEAVSAIEPEETPVEESVGKTSKRKKSAKKATAKKKTALKTTAKKKDGRAASWQKYTRPGVKNESIPDAVRIILETQPDKEFKIAEVMDALFKGSVIYLQL